MKAKVAPAVLRALVLASVSVLLRVAPAAAQSVPQSVKIQGYLSDRAGGTAVPANGVYSLTFEIFDVQVGSVALATAGPLGVTVTNGVYEASIPATAALFGGPARYLQITVNGEVLSPRIPIDSAPFALRAESSVRAETVAAGSVGPAALAPGAVTAPALAAGAVTAPALADGSVGAAKIGVPCADGQVLLRLGGVWTCANLPPLLQVCTDESFASCYTGPAGTVNVGACRPGVSACRPDHAGFAPCVGGVLPGPEICDGLDNDCDGTIDEGDCCGDGTIQAGEGCDDGNRTNADGCSSLCQIEPGHICTGQPSACIVCADDDADGYPRSACGGTDCNDLNSYVHPLAVEVCDGMDNDCDGLIDETCPGPCGDGVIQANETCDDGNATDGDGCSSQCQVRPGYTCIGQPSVCVWTVVCGDGQVSPGEDCDGANLGGLTCQVFGYPGGTLSCTTSCQITLAACTGCPDQDLDGFTDIACGGTDCNDLNSYVHPLAVDLCDGVDYDCDGLIGETCPGPCGDGIIQVNETCDDGNATDGDGCSSQCQVQPGYVCTGQPSVCTSTVVCGDGQIGSGEDCDGANLGGLTCQVFGYPGGTLSCNANCQVTLAACTGCPDQDFDGFTDIACGGTDCNDLNSYVHPLGVEVCDGLDNDCDGLIDDGACQICGDGTLVGAETCDDGNATDGDGCSSLCQVEPGYECTGQPSVCTVACEPGLNNCNGLSADLCECATPLCCGSSCATTHVNGLGQSYYDCNPPGAPGNAATYSQSMAKAARAAWPFAGTDNLGTCGAGVSAAIRQTATSCAVWIYTSARAGYVKLNSSNNSCTCPTTSDTTWN